MIKRYIGILFASILTLSTSAPSAKADEMSAADYQKYFQSPTALAAAAAAAAIVSHCSNPLVIEEFGPDQEGLVQLHFRCDGSEDEEASSMIEFRLYEGGALIPERFFLAG